MPEPARLLFLLNPGKQSRNYILGLVNAARALGIEHLTLELAPLWKHLEKPGPARDDAVRTVHTQIGALLAQHRISHVLGYAQTGIGDLGVFALPGRPAESIFTSRAVRHILLWTDHPNWLLGGCALDEPQRTVLGHPLHTHVLKSPAAASEARDCLGWPNLHAMAMGEDYEALRPVPGIDPIHDVVAIVGGVEPIPEELLPFLEASDPDPADMDRARRTQALAAFERAISKHDADPQQSLACRALAGEWLDLKIARPLDSFWRLAGDLQQAHGPSLAWLCHPPRLWYSAVAALRTMVSWRRDFTLAWLARRVNLGVYGAPTTPLATSQPPGAQAWVDYASQAAAYARGRIAINTNAAWDEEGLTHKPFQIAASGVACIHHDVRGLSDAFEPGKEVIPFVRQRQLLGAVRELCDSPERRAALGAAMHARARQDHTWEHRLPRMLELSLEDARRPP